LLDAVYATDKMLIRSDILRDTRRREMMLLFDARQMIFDARERG